MRTCVEHIVDQISRALDKHISGDTGPVRLEKILLVTGGGAHNMFLMDCLKQKVKDNEVQVTIVETDRETIEYKEAAIFAFLGLRCLLGLSNTNRWVTGAKRDAVCGSIHVPPGGAPITFDLGMANKGLRPRSFSHIASPGLLGAGLGSHGPDGKLGSHLGSDLPGLQVPRIVRGGSGPKAAMPARMRKISAPPSMSYMKPPDPSLLHLK